MNEIIVGGVAAVVALLGGGAGLRFFATRRTNTASAERIDATVRPADLVKARSAPAETGDALSSTDLQFLDSTGNVVFNTRLLPAIPEGAQSLSDGGGVALARARQLAADVFKGAVSLPNKTVELVFDPHIQRGLAEGSLEIVPAVKGGVRAIARQKDTKAFAGHGRILEGGKVRQVAAGAFQLISIAVAQSHLDDINRSLADIRKEVTELRLYLDHKDRSKLVGACDYLSELGADINAMKSLRDIPVEKKVQIEAITREVSEWVDQLSSELHQLRQNVASQVDKDTFGGTENTYSALKVLADSAHRLVEKRNLLLRVMALLRLCGAYIDPLNMRPVPQSWPKGLSALATGFAELTMSLRDKSNQLLSRALWNSQETLDKRRRELVGLSEDLQHFAVEHQDGYESLMRRLDDNVRRIRRDDGKIRLAMTFDSESNVSAVAVI
ncbi:hypothetical protein QCE63_01465 [Caballeronia sp. LZ065]|uniref:hypothetical protein n=1 Tax=Caballeronia sp. LZ065 TaxID=3038571 RepID=UPI002861DA1A|nr:hypothetical protein [Caballeronia sp. LZ065]MDR5778094.1 hypothetical protein [Caballeronia sp. LZ065]